ncbi:MAG: TonB family protein, partial [Metallibacterium scheffleri]
PRPLLLLPPDFEQRYDTAQRRQILHHELCHRAQGDAWWNLLAALLGALFWWHPLRPWAQRAFALDQELACDARLFASLQRPALRSYAGTLLQAASTLPLPLGSGVSHPRQLKERIAMLAQTRRSAPRRAAGATLILILLGAAVLAAHSTVPVATRAVAGMNPPTQDISFNNKLPPRYPIDAVKKHEQGTVFLAVLVGTEGMPLSIRQAHKPGPQPAQSLVNASLQAAAKWRFNPATRNGKPVAAWIEVPIQFLIYAEQTPATQHTRMRSA